MLNILLSKIPAELVIPILYHSFTHHGQMTTLKECLSNSEQKVPNSLSKGFLLHLHANNPLELASIFSLQKPKTDDLLLLNKEGNTLLHCALSDAESVEMILEAYEEEERMQLLRASNSQGISVLECSLTNQKTIEVIMGLLSKSNFFQLMSAVFLPCELEFNADGNEDEQKTVRTLDEDALKKTPAKLSEFLLKKNCEGISYLEWMLSYPASIESYLKTLSATNQATMLYSFLTVLQIPLPTELNNLDKSLASPDFFALKARLLLQQECIKQSINKLKNSQKDLLQKHMLMSARTLIQHSINWLDQKTPNLLGKIDPELYSELEGLVDFLLPLFKEVAASTECFNPNLKPQLQSLQHLSTLYQFFTEMNSICTPKMRFFASNEQDQYDAKSKATENFSTPH